MRYFCDDALYKLTFTLQIHYTMKDSLTLYFYAGSTPAVDATEYNLNNMEVK